jgi:CheY-like chemotaxis protein
VVDDSLAVRSRLVALLREVRGDDVRSAEDATGALDSLTAWSPSLILLDLQMPGRSGLEIIGELKARVPSPIVVVFSGNSTAYHRAESLRRGADFFLDKAGDVGRLLDLLAALDRGERPTMP